MTDETTRKPDKLQGQSVMQLLERDFAFQDYIKLYPDFTARLGEILELIPQNFQESINNYIEVLQNPKADLSRLQTVLGVSQAEASLILLLVDGHSLADIARERSVSRNTVRNQLHSIYQKTHVNHQPALIRKALDVLER